jgi:acyl-CoA thioesterase-1
MKLALWPGILSPDPAPDTSWRSLALRIGLILACLAALLLPPRWIYLGYVVTSVPCAICVAVRTRFALAGLVPAVYALIKGGYLPLWTIAVLLLGLLPMFVRPRAILAGLWAASLLVCAIEFHSMGRASVPAGKEIVILGDSLCEFGLETELRKISPVPVLRRSAPGITAHEALEQIVPRIESLRERCFVVELGGHDFLKGFPASQIEADLDAILTRLGAGGNHLILVEIPTGLVRDHLGGVYRRLARKHGAALIPDTMVRTFVLIPGYSNDGLHPNLEGSRLFAREIVSRLE